jgi:hypothetical protein
MSEQVQEGSEFDRLIDQEFDFYGVDNYQFKLGDAIWEAIEDPSDGYRSMLDTVERKDTAGSIFFGQPVARVRVEHHPWACVAALWHSGLQRLLPVLCLWLPAKAAPTSGAEAGTRMKYSQVEDENDALIPLDPNLCGASRDEHDGAFTETQMAFVLLLVLIANGLVLLLWVAAIEANNMVLALAVLLGLIYVDGWLTYRLWKKQNPGD